MKALGQIFVKPPPPKASVWKEEFKGDICLEMKSVMSTTQKEKLK